MEHTDPRLFDRYMAEEAKLEREIPTGDPFTFHCALPLRDGSPCRTRKLLAGRAGNKVLMCPRCDQPDLRGLTAPTWSDAEA